MGEGEEGGREAGRGLQGLDRESGTLDALKTACVGGEGRGERERGWEGGG